MPNSALAWIRSLAIPAGVSISHHWPSAGLTDFTLTMAHLGQLAASARNAKTRSCGASIEMVLVMAYEIISEPPLHLFPCLTLKVSGRLARSGERSDGDCRSAPPT